MDPTAENLYVHFPFCRRKCSYCVLHSRVGVPIAQRADYVRRLTDAVLSRLAVPEGGFKTVYFGGGSPALCDLKPLLAALLPRSAAECELTVELHPLDVTDELLTALREGGVNRISMGVEALDDATLKDMGRGYTLSEAERAFARIKRYFENAGIDLIVGYPQVERGKTAAEELSSARIADWGLAHCSVYSLILEDKSILAHRLATAAHRPVDADACPRSLPSDDTVMDELRGVAAALAAMGLERYEISNYALPGRECRHNLAVWRGEDYLGLGEGASGRIGSYRTVNWWGEPLEDVAEKVSPEIDRKERTLFRLRTREGIDAAAYPEWRPLLERYADEGLLKRGKTAAVYVLTERGTEVCDSILADLV